jgi:hypothetical protein
MEVGLVLARRKSSIGLLNLFASKDVRIKGHVLCLRVLRTVLNGDPGSQALSSALSFFLKNILICFEKELDPGPTPPGSSVPPPPFRSEIPPGEKECFPWRSCVAPCDL